VLATGDVGTVEGEDLLALKDIERRALVRDDVGAWLFDDMSETDAISEVMSFCRTGGGVEVVSVTTVLAHSKVSDVLELDAVSELMGLLCVAGGVDGVSVTIVLAQSMSPNPSPTSSASGLGS
jgi:hypothetical protein